MSEDNPSEILTQNQTDIIKTDDAKDSNPSENEDVLKTHENNVENEENSNDDLVTDNIDPSNAEPEDLKKDDVNSLSVNLRMISEIENESDQENDDQSDTNKENLDEQKMALTEESEDILRLENDIFNADITSCVPDETIEDEVALSPDLSESEKDLIEQYNNSKILNQELLEKNKSLQKQLKEYLELNKIIFNESEVQSATDENELGIELLLEFEKIFIEGVTYFKRSNKETEEFENHQKNVLKALSDDSELLYEQIKKCGKRLVFERSGKLLTKKTIEEMITKLKNKIKILHETKWEYVDVDKMLKNNVDKLQSFSNKSEYVNSDQYDKLKKEKQLHEDRINSHNDKLKQLNDKCMDYGQILTHIKSKINFIDKESSGIENELQNLDANLSQEICKLNKIKLKGVKLAKISKEKESEYLTDPILLKDYEKCVEIAEDLRKQCDELQNEVSLKQAALKYKLEEKETVVPEYVVRVRPRFHSTAVLQRSIDLQ